LPVYFPPILALTPTALAFIYALVKAQSTSERTSEVFVWQSNKYETTTDAIKAAAGSQNFSFPY
jgi:hypothetical protein